MNCPKCADRMSEYIDHCLGGAELEEFEAHIEACEACAEALKEMRSVVDSLGELRGATMPVDCWSKVAPRLQSRPTARGLWARVLRPVFAVPALAAAAAVAFVLLWIAGPGSQPITAPEIEHYLSAHSSAQAQQRLVDPDVAIVTAELEKVTLVSGAVRP